MKKGLLTSAIRIQEKWVQQLNWKGKKCLTLYDMQNIPTRKKSCSLRAETLYESILGVCLAFMLVQVRFERHGGSVPCMLCGEVFIAVGKARDIISSVRIKYFR